MSNVSFSTTDLNLIDEYITDEYSDEQIARHLIDKRVIELRIAMQAVPFREMVKARREALANGTVVSTFPRA